MIVGYEQWHDGTGYDLDIPNAVHPDELVELENLLLARRASDWRGADARGYQDRQEFGQ